MKDMLKSANIVEAGGERETGAMIMVFREWSYWGFNLPEINPIVDPIFVVVAVGEAYNCSVVFVVQCLKKLEG